MRSKCSKTKIPNDERRNVGDCLIHQFLYLSLKLSENLTCSSLRHQTEAIICWLSSTTDRGPCRYALWKNASAEREFYPEQGDYYHYLPLQVLGNWDTPESRIYRKTSIFWLFPFKNIPTSRTPSLCLTPPISYDFFWESRVSKFPSFTGILNGSDGVERKKNSGRLGKSGIEIPRPCRELFTSMSKHEKATQYWTEYERSTLNYYPLRKMLNYAELLQPTRTHTSIHFFHANVLVTESGRRLSSRRSTDSAKNSSKCSKSSLHVHVANCRQKKASIW